METISDRRTIQEIATGHCIHAIQEIATGHCIHAIQVSQRKRQLLDGTSEIFTRGKKINAKKKTAALFQ